MLTSLECMFNVILIIKFLLAYRYICPDVEQITIDVSIDGLPLFRKSRKNLIPIQIRVVELSSIPVFVVGVFGGSSKPGCLEEFLNPLVKDINNLIDNGINIGDKMFPFFMRVFVADAPMRAFLKGL